MCLFRFLVFTLIFSLSLPAVASTKAEAASLVEAARQKMLEEDRKEEASGEAEALRAEALRKAKEAGFIALSKNRMSWIDAVEYCRSYGGRLPLINGSDGLARNEITADAPVDGFGRLGAPWPAGLPTDYCWTGTVLTGGPAYSWFVFDEGGIVVVRSDGQRNEHRVVCVP